jgi:hypothetical protein
MSDVTPTEKSSGSPDAYTADAPVDAETGIETAQEPVALVEPAPVEPAVDHHAEEPVMEHPAEHPAVEPVAVEPVAEHHAVEPVAEPVVVEPVAEPAVADAAIETSTTEAVTPVAPVADVAGQQVVYVQTPRPPKVRGNRVVGTLLAILGAIIFAGLYGVVSALIIYLQSRDLFGPTFGAFLGSAFFWVPGLVFLVGLVLLTLLLNRAGWWAHVLGSLVLAVAVYFGMIGVLLLIGNVFRGSPEPISFATLAINPWVIAAAIVAREVSIWIGLAIAGRGRRVKVRNVEARSAWDREQQEKKAEYERTATAAA